MNTYIHNTLHKPIEFKQELPNNIYEVGETYEDFKDGKWIKLNDEQILFYNENPNANPQEIINMQMQAININTLKRDKIIHIEDYDKSNSVNGFFLNGQEVWVDRETRVSLMSTTQIKKQLGEENTTIWFGDINVTLPCDSVIQMLSTLEMYAYDCFNQTAKHKSTVNSLTSKEEIESYDITEGYPEKLSFEI